MEKAEFYKVVSQFEKDFINLNQASDFYDMEDRLASILNKVGAKILEAETGLSGTDRRKKKPFFVVSEKYK